MLAQHFRGQIVDDIAVPTTKGLCDLRNVVLTLGPHMASHGKRRQLQARYPTLGAVLEHPRRLGVEFKAHNPAIALIRKDLEKLLREDCDGLWFHVLQDADSGTLGSLLGKFAEALETLRAAAASCGHSVTLTFVVLDKRFWFTRHVSPGGFSDLNLNLAYSVQRDKIAVANRGGWHDEELF